jgi:hypothetical protein
MPLAIKLRTTAVTLALCLAAGTAAASAIGLPIVVKEEKVTGGALDQVWLPGFGVGRSFTALTLPAGDPAIPSPTGDNTVAVLQNVATDLGGIAETVTDPQGNNDYLWEGDFFTGAGNTRRGLIIRANAQADGFQSFYQFVINAGLFVIRFRKFVNGAPIVPDLGSWNAIPALPAVPAQNTWHHMKVMARGNEFRCFFDGTELTAGTPIVDTTTPILSGWVGAYNFSATVGEVPVYFDNLKLTIDGATPARKTSWSRVKELYR